MKTDDMAKHFPLTPDLPNIELRNREKFIVNRSHGEKYSRSTIPYCQRKLNEFSQGAKPSDQMSDRKWREWMAGLEGRLRDRREQRAAEGDLVEREPETEAGEGVAGLGGAGEGGAAGGVAAVGGAAGGGAGGAGAGDGGAGAGDGGADEAEPWDY